MNDRGRELLKGIGVTPGNEYATIPGTCNTCETKNIIVAILVMFGRGAISNNPYFRGTPFLLTPNDGGIDRRKLMRAEVDFKKEIKEESWNYDVLDEILSDLVDSISGLLPNGYSLDTHPDLTEYGIMKDGLFNDGLENHEMGFGVTTDDGDVI